MPYRLEITDTFSAAHAIVLQGEREPLHGHDWLVTLTIERDALDEDGLVCDFHALERALGAVLDPWRNRTLNDLPPFAGGEVNPTAERVAEHIAGALTTHIPPPARLVSVRVTEAVGCAATVYPGPPGH
ncbi:MAG: 6-carboxytetrahydropterin synthase [Planctomycetota bacterium]